MKPMIIDVVGTIKELVKWALTQVLLFLGVIFFGLSAPLLFTVGAMFLASRFPESAPTWAIIYLILGPFACAMWMSILSHLPTWVSDWKIRRAGGHVHSNFGRGFQKGISFQSAGLFGSLLSEGVFTYAAHRLNVIPNHLMLFFAVAPFFVFAPALLVLLSRWIRRDEYATA
ncbi:MAG: hypothetical protein WA741_35550 [Candidatus Sulfotelmatobacter sp.]